MTNLPAIAAASSAAAAAAAYGAYTSPTPTAMLMTGEQFSSSYGLTSAAPTAATGLNGQTVNSKNRPESNTNNASGSSIEVNFFSFGCFVFVFYFSFLKIHSLTEQICLNHCHIG